MLRTWDHTASQGQQALASAVTLSSLEPRVAACKGHVCWPADRLSSLCSLIYSHLRGGENLSYRPCSHLQTTPSLPSRFSPLRPINSLQRSQIRIESPGLPVRAFNNPSPASLFLFSTLFRDKSNTSTRCPYFAGLKPTTHLPT